MDLLISKNIARFRAELNELLVGSESNSLDAATQLLLECEGTIHLSGVGSAAFVAKKIAQTLISVSKRAAFLQPVDALHGDIGAVHQDDIAILLSDSGECEELIKLIPLLRKKKSTIISFTRAPANKIARSGDLALSLETNKSGASFGGRFLSTFDTTVLLLLDTIVVKLMFSSNFTRKKYAENHPSGKIGKLAQTSVSDVLTPWQDLVLVEAHEVGIDTLMKYATQSKGHGCILVVDGQRRLQGTVSDADLRRAIVKLGRACVDMTTFELMNYSKAFPRTCGPGDSIILALSVLNETPVVDYLPVIDTDKKVIGMLTVRSLQRAGIL